MNKNVFIEKIQQCMGEKDFVHSIANHKWYTYGQVWKNACLYRGFLKAQGLQEIAVVLENGIELFMLYFACMLGNIKIIPIDPQKSEVEIGHILENHPEITVIHSTQELPALTEESADKEEILPLLENIDFEKIYMVTYTSGSTGQAKGVQHSLKNLLLASVSFGDMVGFSEDSCVCHTMPMTYMAGILNTIFMPFIQGSRIVLFPRFSVMTAVTFWKNVETLGVNTFWLSPTMLNILLTVDRKGTAAEYFKSTKSTFCIGTAPLFPQLKQQFEQKYGVQLLQSYGLSETLFISTKVNDVDGEKDSVGMVLPDVSLQFADSGEILIDVPWMFLGYSNENTEEYFQGDCYLSGDLGEIKDRHLYITGRKKDLIIRGGMNISPKQIEEALLDSGMVKECSVASVLEKFEEKIICWYVGNGEPENMSQQLNEVVVEQLGKAYKVDKFVPVKEIPKNLNGKVDKEKLKREYIHDC